MGRQILARAQIRDAEGMLELVRVLLMSVLASVRPRQDLVLENLLLRHQLVVLSRPTRRRRRARLRTWDKLLWAPARRCCDGWREHLTFVTADTVVRWHRKGWRLFLRWMSASRGGRPHVTTEIRDLIATMSRDNRLWGTERIRGELLKLGIVVSSRSIRGDPWRRPARSPSQTWRTFLRNHTHHLWASDLLTVPTLTFKTLYVLIFIAHGRRELVHVNVTANPTAAWGVAATHRGHTVGPETPSSAPRSGCRLWPRVSKARSAHRHRRYRDAHPRAEGERHRGATDRHLAPRMSRPHHRLGPAASSVSADRIRAVLQPRASASDAQTSDPSTQAASNHRYCSTAAGVEWTTPRLRASRLITSEVLPSHSTKESAFSRNGGHALALAMAKRSGTSAQIGLRDPALTAANDDAYSQSVLTTETYSVEPVWASFGGWWRWQDRVISLGGSNSAYIDEYFAIYPAEALTVEKNLFYLLKPVQLGPEDGTQPKIGVQFSSANNRNIIDLAVDPLLTKHVYLTEGDSTVWELDSLSGRSSALASVEGARRIVIGGKERMLYVLTPGSIVSLTREGRVISRVSLSAPLADITYDANEDVVIGITATGDTVRAFDAQLAPKSTFSLSDKRFPKVETSRSSSIPPQAR